MERSCSATSDPPLCADPMEKAEAQCWARLRCDRGEEVGWEVVDRERWLLVEADRF